MRRPQQLAARARPASGHLATTLLGADHPLVRATDILHSVIREWVLVAAVLIGSIIARIGGQAWAWPLILGAGMVLSILTLLIAGFRQCKHDHAIDLILKGCQNIPIAAIQDQRRRLLSTRTRRRLAQSFEEVVDQVQNWRTLQAGGHAPCSIPGRSPRSSRICSRSREHSRRRVSQPRESRAPSGFSPMEPHRFTGTT